MAVQGPLRANNSELLRDAVLSGLGIAQLPDFSAAAALRAGRLREVLPAGGRWVSSATRSTRSARGARARRAVQVLVEHLRGALGAGFGVEAPR